MARFVFRILFSLLFSSICVAQDTSDFTEIRVGVRQDAYPMSYYLASDEPALVHTITGPLRKQGYAGYMVYICDRVLVEMQRKFGTSFEVTAVPVKAKDRFDKLDQGDFQILCDPTTATKLRLDGLISSPPVFITGTSYATGPPKTNGEDCGSIVGMVRTSRTSVAENKILANLLRRGELFDHREILEQFISRSGGDDIATNCTTAQGEELTREDPVLYMDTHAEVAEAFCNDQIRIYVGDMEIISHTLNRFDNCRFTGANQSYSDDRYVILGKIFKDSSYVNKAFFVGHFFGILSQMIFFKPSILDEAFDRTFPGAQQSKKLKLLYWGLRG